MTDNYYYAQRGQTFGPVSQKQLQQMLASAQLQPEDLVWREGMPSWVPAGQIPGLQPPRPQVSVAPPASIRGETIRCQKCPRCEGEHPQFPVKRLSKPTFDGFTHWGVCPITGDPVLFSFKSGTKDQQ